MKRATYENVLDAPANGVADVEPFEAIELELGRLWAVPPVQP